MAPVPEPPVNQVSFPAPFSAVPCSFQSSCINTRKNKILVNLWPLLFIILFQKVFIRKHLSSDMFQYKDNYTSF